MSPKSNSLSCRWGIRGASFIARKNWQSIRDAGNATLVALASRDIAKAQAFIDECQAQVPHAVTPEALGSYEALLARADIDAVYIPLPTGLRKEWVIRAARAGKHVLVEKPVGCVTADVAEMLEVCEQHNVQFMDGVMFMHGQRLQPLCGAPAAPLWNLGSKTDHRIYWGVGGGGQALFERPCETGDLSEPFLLIAAQTFTGCGVNHETLRAAMSGNEGQTLLSPGPTRRGDSPGSRCPPGNRERTRDRPKDA